MMVSSECTIVVEHAIPPIDQLLLLLLVLLVLLMLHNVQGQRQATDAVETHAAATLCCA
jgi:hypothetical protein